MIINVKQTHIDKGVARSFTRCAIALAIKDTFGVSSGVYVEGNIVGVNGREYNTSRSARRFIKVFDKNKSNCKPFNFKLDA